ncbi:MAG TPA: dihydrolipoyl dehydrogenase [bacterium (Candidatus Stahlbacteria)]|nr:dihydrolipoyl dehydrogenase [Candidatus Stahlbacteria bacterium]
MNKFDIAIIGGGSAGYVAAIRAAQLGAKVAIVEKDLIGGTCLNRGCIPTKAMLAIADVMRRADRFNMEVGDVKLASVIDRKNKIVDRLRKGVEFLLRKKGVEIFTGVAKVIEPGVIEIDGNKGIESNFTIIATGSEPLIPSSFRVDGKNVITSKEALDLDRIPESILIIGGGAVGIEFAIIFNQFSSKVTIVEMMDDILPNLKEKKITSLLSRTLESMGIDVKTKTKVKKIEVQEKGVFSVLSSGDIINTEKVLVAVGRSLNSHEFKDIGIEIDKGRIVTDERMHTNLPNTYAIGDVVGEPLFAHKAAKEGIVAAENIHGIESRMDYNAIPYCIFSHPEIAYVGITEDEAKAKGYNIRIGEFPLIANGKALCVGESEGFVKVVASDDGTVLGVFIVGPNASDLINLGTIAIKHQMKVDELSDFIYPHPTLSEALKETFLDVRGEAIHKA